MAIAELGRLRVGVFQRVAERTTPKPVELPLKPVQKFTRNNTLDLARAYVNSLWHAFWPPYSDSERASLQGTMEIQKMTLEMLGQHHIARMNSKIVQKAERIEDGDLTAEIRTLSERDVRRLEKIYREGKSFAVEHKLEDRERTEIKADEMKVFSRMLEAGRILDTLGQRDLVIAINNSFIPPFERVDWAANRSTGDGESM